MSMPSELAEVWRLSSSTTFVNVTIEGFRGFRDRQRVVLDASAVVLYGSNGSGKTSVIDALQWLLLGSLERLEPWRTRRNSEHVVSAFASTGVATVEAELRLKGRTVLLRRHGKHDASILQWSDEGGTVSGDEADSRIQAAFLPGKAHNVGLKRRVMTSALLQ